MDGNPMISGLGFAIMRRTFYETGDSIGKVKEEFYFDEHDTPICLSLGQYGLRNEYDEFGRATTITYLDSEGHPAETIEGYTVVKRTYYNDDTVKTEFYYDKDGKPVSASEGQYGISKYDGKTVYLDQQGNELFNLRNFLYNSQIWVVLIGIVVIFISLIAGKKVNAMLLLSYIVFIVYMTLMHRSNAGTGLVLKTFWSYRKMFSDTKLAWEVLNNIWLFIPLGTMLYRVFPRTSIILAPIVISILIEITQYVTGTGLCELDDVISNGIGGAVGYGTVVLLTGFLHKTRKTSYLNKTENS